MIRRILFSSMMLISLPVLAQVQQGDWTYSSRIQPFLIKNGCAEKVTLMMILPGERPVDCYGIMLDDVRVTDPLGQKVELGTVLLFPAGRELSEVEETVGEMIQVLKRKRVAGQSVEMSSLRYLPQPLALKDLSGNPADGRTYLLGGLTIRSSLKSAQGPWQLTRSNRRSIGLN